MESEKRKVLESKCKRADLNGELVSSSLPMQTAARPVNEAIHASEMSEASPRSLPKPGRHRHVVCGSSVLDRGSAHYCIVGDAVNYGVN